MRRQGHILAFASCQAGLESRHPGRSALCGEDGVAEIRSMSIAVGTPITERPPHRTVRAAFPHTAPTLDV
jgi:hypothetical protein